MLKCYDYKCSNCDWVFEDYIESTKVEPVRCQACDSLDVVRQFPRPQMVKIPGSNQINP